ncbi:sensor histidine kinase [Sphingomonas sp. NFR15]|uniref:sensor histidine kinase n=1 Tax=Sphingomonas sp. NFR15 TaxID=1566282 RepID=UPI00115FF112|nr:sensor histidine kinase [Sphingomonas sp. NFR15]
MALFANIMIFSAGAKPTGTAPAPAYRLTRWSFADGAPAGIRAIAQTLDGFLWLGTSNGLYRFDGVTFERIETDDRRPSRSRQVNALLATQDGQLLVGYQKGGIAVYRGGRLVDLRLPAQVVGYAAQLTTSPDGSVWALLQGPDMAWLGQLRQRRWRWFHSGTTLPSQPGQSVLPVRNGDTYLAMHPSILRLRRGGVRFEVLPTRVGLGANLLEDAAGRIWIADETSIRSVLTPSTGTKLPPFRFDNQPRPSTVLQSGEVWIGGDDGPALRYNPGAITSPLAPMPTQSLATPSGSGLARTLSIFQDREGNIWTGRVTGLERLTRGGPAILSPDLDLTTGFVRAGRAGDIYVGARDGIYRLNRLGAAPSRILLAGRQIYMLCGAEDGRLLVADVDHTYLISPKAPPRLIRQNNEFTPQSCAVDRQGRFWVQKHGLFSVQEDRFVKAPDSLGPQQRGRVLRMLGAALVNYSPRPYIVTMRDGRTTQLWGGKDVVIGTVQAIVPFDTGFIAAGEYGLAYHDSSGFSVLDARRYPFLGAVTGLTTTQDGRTWLIGREGIFSLATSDLRSAFKHSGAPLPVSRFGHEQGLQSRLSSDEANDAMQDVDGNIWLNTNQGLAWIDPTAQLGAKVGPNVVIQSLDAAGRHYLGSSAVISLPVGTTDLRFDFTALGLTDAGSNRFRYRLDGRDQEWTDAGSRREAFFTNLGPGRYVFRVKAANSAGIWSPTDATLSFAIKPAFHQTKWFIALIAGIACVALWLLYRLRLAAVGERLRQRIEGQVEERERIARELHDTYLQSVQSLILRFQAIAEGIPSGSRGRLQIEEALDRSDEILVEGRKQVLNLRNIGAVADLEARLLPLLESRETLHTVGRQRLVCAPIVEQTAAIVREALLNARRHAAATGIDVSITCRRRGLTVVVRDNGVGIDTATAAEGREGHFGLCGMRERAEKMHARLVIEGTPGTGTIIRLEIPARTAFRAPSRWLRLIG